MYVRSHHMVGGGATPNRNEWKDDLHQTDIGRKRIINDDKAIVNNNKKKKTNKMITTTTSIVYYKP